MGNYVATNFTTSFDLGHTKGCVASLLRIRSILIPNSIELIDLGISGT
jgi:hypothetical protein